MKVFHFSFLLLLFSLLSFSQTPTFATKKSYIVYLGTHSHGPEPTSEDLDRATNYHHEFLGSFLGSVEQAKESISSSYTRYINGFAADLEEEHAQQLAKHPDVVSVFLNKPRATQTTRSWSFLGLEKDNVIPLDSAWKKGRFGEDIIIGGIDSGVWPESKSFSDEGMGPVPSKWRGICQNDTHYGVKCNRKLIGMRYYNQAIMAEARRNSSFVVTPEFSTARDMDGHGSHTLSTAAGNFVADVSVFGSGYGTAKGGSPKARVAGYKVCWPGENGRATCYDEDMINAFADAIHDGVDIITMSIYVKEPKEYFDNGIAIGSFHAMMHGILTVVCAGNEGPNRGTVDNLAPWLFTVGASTMDREFTSYVTLGNKKQLQGASLTPKGGLSHNFYELVSGEDARLANATAEDAKPCKPGTLDPNKVKGKLVLCIGAGGHEGYEAARAGAVGMIWATDRLNKSITAFPCMLPATRLNFTDGQSVFDYIKSTSNTVASMTEAVTDFNTKSSPVMASFSSRGPSKIDPAIIKPDVIAPGVNVIAAYSENIGPSNHRGDTRRIPYNTDQGTSMATPHVAGAAGLIKTLHPDWSPAAIRSAIMTTATTRDTSNSPILDFNGTKATPFEYGSGHLSPNRAMDPGLVYELSLYDYLGYLCNRHYNESMVKKFVDPDEYPCPKSFDMASFNYPSIAIPDFKGSVTVTRRVKNVGTPSCTYNVQVTDIPGISTAVEPNSLTFTKYGEERTFKITFTSKKNLMPKDYVFGELTWSDGYHNVRSPIALKA